MTTPTRLEFPIAKAQYLFASATEPGKADKQKFWREVMWFESPEAIRDAIIAQISLELLQPVGQNDYGQRYEAIILVTGRSGVSWQIRTGWIVLFGEDMARFVTAFPQRFGRQQ
ncbi:DUF6883 domain-containing protein [Microcoleus sp. EPA2]|uniref:DUF6883 domain-containing protein n=1 Tax=Microcoleus sp. EPA2 TaxID=2841654 RepID=UPI00312B52FB